MFFFETRCTVLYLSALEVCSRQGAIQIYIYLTLPSFSRSPEFLVHPLPLQPCCYQFFFITCLSHFILTCSNMGHLPVVFHFFTVLYQLFSLSSVYLQSFVDNCVAALSLHILRITCAILLLICICAEPVVHCSGEALSVQTWTVPCVLGTELLGTLQCCRQGSNSCRFAVANTWITVMLRTDTSVPDFL